MDELELGDDRIAHALDFLEPLGRGTDDLSEGAEPVDQRFGKRLGVGPGYRAEKHKLEELVIRERIRPRFAKASTQALAMSEIMGPCVCIGKTLRHRQACWLGG